MLGTLNPVLNHAAGQRNTAVGTSQVAFDPLPAGTWYFRAVANTTRVFIRTDGEPIKAAGGVPSAAELAKCTVVEPNVPLDFGVEESATGITIYACTESGTASLSIVPHKARKGG